MEHDPLPYAVLKNGDVECNTDGLLPWWSIAKMVLATAVLRLCEEERLMLDDPYLERSYSIRQLLQHTAGVRTYGGPAYHTAVASGEPVWSVPEMLERVQVDTLLFEPGRDWSYSNVGYLFICQLLEEATGQPLGEALQSLVFHPLGLETPRHVRTPNELNAVLWGNPSSYHPGWVYHGLLIGSPSDAVRLIYALRHPGLLSRASLDAMRTIHPIGGSVEGRPWQTHGYGLGLMMGDMADIGPAWGHSGVGPDTVSAAYYFSDRDVAVAAFAKGSDESVVEFEVARRAMEITA